MNKTLFDRIWDAHVVGESDGSTLLYIDRHILHDLKSGMLLRMEAQGDVVKRPAQSFAVIDHSLPTENPLGPYDDPETGMLIRTMREKAKEVGFHLFDVENPANGITHVVGPEQGITLPGITLVCGDSHTATHGALGALAMGIGTTECEHVLVTQVLRQKKPRTMRVNLAGRLPEGVYSKDVILALIGEIGIGGGTGHVIEYAGVGARAMSLEARMSMCNMTIEAGARAGMVAPDDLTFEYVKGRPFAPSEAHWDQALAYWKTLATGDDAMFDREVNLDVGSLVPQVTWGTNPSMVTGIDGAVPDPAQAKDANERESWERALEYMGLTPGTPMSDISVDTVFIGSCTNSRIEDLRLAAKVMDGRKVADGVRVLVVPGSGLIKRQAEDEGLARIFMEAGAQWRDPGCSMCVAMNGDMLQPGQRSASTSNRNFEGRQGYRGRTHLVSPAMAAAAAVHGRFMDVRTLNGA